MLASDSADAVISGECPHVVWQGEFSRCWISFGLVQSFQNTCNLLPVRYSDFPASVLNWYLLNRSKEARVCVQLLHRTPLCANNGYDLRPPDNPKTFLWTSEQEHPATKCASHLLVVNPSISSYCSLKQSRAIPFRLRSSSYLSLGGVCRLWRTEWCHSSLWKVSISANVLTTLPWTCIAYETDNESIRQALGDSILCRICQELIVNGGVGSANLFLETCLFKEFKPHFVKQPITLVPESESITIWLTSWSTGRVVVRMFDEAPPTESITKRDNNHFVKTFCYFEFSMWDSNAFDDTWKLVAWVKRYSFHSIFLVMNPKLEVCNCLPVPFKIPQSFKLVPISRWDKGLPTSM